MPSWSVGQQNLQTPLLLAAAGKERKHTIMVRTLLKAGAKVNVKDKAGNTVSARPSPTPSGHA
jgi:ankyrin repeat protein